MLKLSKAAAVLLILSFLPMQSAFATPEFDEKWAIVVGVDSSLESGNTSPFRVAAAREFYNFLITKANFSADHCKLFLGKDATRQNVLTAIYQSFLPRSARPTDLAVIYISAEISPADMDPAKESYFVLSDTKRENLYGTGWSLQGLSQIKSRSFSKNILSIVNSKNSKQLLKQKLADGSSAKDPTQSNLLIISGEENKPDDYSEEKFTTALVSALQIKGAETSLKDALAVLKNPSGHANSEALNSSWQISSPAKDPRNSTAL